MLLTKEICFQRDPVSYKSKTCIACFAKDESLEHLAECQIYQKIWEHIEKIIIREIEIKLYNKWKIIITSQKLKEVFLGMRIEDKLNRRKLYIRGLTNNSLISEVKRVIGSGSKTSKVICWFTEVFWSNFFERLWKFRCEVMIEWEKKNGIDTKKKKTKQKNKNKAFESKETQNLDEDQNRETKKEKERRIQKVTEAKVNKWVEDGVKESWLSFKNN